MSRSTRYPVHVISKRIDEKAHRAVRKHVKQKLQTMVLDEPPIIDIEGDTKSLGKSEWGTRFGYDFMGSLGEEERAEYEEDKRKCARK